MSEEKLVPKLRFSEFSDEWTSSKLKEICIVQDGTHSTPNYTDSGIPFFSVDTIINNVPPKYISEKDHKKLIKRCEPKKGDILLSRITGGILGFPKLVDWDYEFSIYVSLALLSSITINSNYLNYYIQSPVYRADFLSKSLLIASPPKINLSDLEITLIKYPSAIEQEKISNFISLVDKKIGLLEQKYQHYQEFKKYLMQQIFAQKLRFNGFKEEWIQTTIDDLFETITDYVAAGSFADIRKNVQYQKEGYAQLIRTADLKNKFENDDFVYVNKHAFEYLYRVNLNEKCIVLPNIGNVGEVYFVNPNDLPHEHNVLAPNAILLKSSENIEFKYHLLNSSYFKNQLDIINESAGRGKFNKTNLKKIKLFVPPAKDEQNKIATFLSSTEQKIDLIQDQISYMEDFKKGLLQQMFV